MQSVETRNVGRDSLFLFADLTIEGLPAPTRVKVRNLSNGGMMAEADIAIARGDRLTVKLRNIEQVRGSVAWVQGTRFGIAFDTEIDPQVVRAPVSGAAESQAPHFVRPPAQPTPGSNRPLRIV